jgi:predicted MPP superfamily phosphohydrolase
MVPADDVARAIDLLRLSSPDLIVLGGDYVTWADRSFLGPVAELLAQLEAPHGVFAILGNHDNERGTAAALAARRIQLLRDARTRLGIRHESLELAGLRFWTTKFADIANVVRGSKGPTILLAHNPRRVIEAAALGVPAVLSGHTHGGQVVLPGIGPLAARRFPVVAGLATRGETSIFVSRGVGTVYVPVRLNCPPEVAIVTLRPRTDDAPAGHRV